MNQSAVDAAIVPSLPAPLTLDKQGELIDRIEYHVTQATDYVDYGRSEIGKAKEYMIKARKVMHDTSTKYGSDRILLLNNEFLLHTLWGGAHLNNSSSQPRQVSAFLTLPTID